MVIYHSNTLKIQEIWLQITNRRRLRLRLCRLISWKYFENIFALNHVSKMIAWSGLVFARGWLIEIMQSENFVKNSGWIKLESTNKVLHIGGSSTTINGNQSKTKDTSEKHYLTLRRPIGLHPHAPVAQKIANQRWLIANSSKNRYVFI